MLKQPVLGVVSTVLVCAASLGFISLFDFPTFAGWVAYYLICVVTVQIVILALWRTEYPRFAASHAQPVKGILTTAVALAGGAAVCGLFFVTAGGGISPPAPMLIDFAIGAVCITFFLCIVWGGWPSNVWVKSPVAAGVVQLMVGYGVNFLLFRTLFNYQFMAGAPVYVASLDPQGVFNAGLLLPWYVSVLAAMFVVIAFDLWPLTKNPRLMQQPVLGLVWMLLIVAIGSAVFYVGIVIVRLDPVVFLVSVPVAYLFGSIVVLNMCENGLLANASQPAKGVLNVLASIDFGAGLSLIYWVLKPAVSGPLPSGPPTYASQLWLASALLAATFPAMVIYSAFFNYWPLRHVEAAAPHTQSELA